MLRMGVQGLKRFYIEHAFAHLIQNTFRIVASTGQSKQSITDWPPQSPPHAIGQLLGG